MGRPSSPVLRAIAHPVSLHGSPPWPPARSGPPMAPNALASTAAALTHLGATTCVCTTIRGGRSAPYGSPRPYVWSSTGRRAGPAPSRNCHARVENPLGNLCIASNVDDISEAGNHPAWLRDQRLVGGTPPASSNSASSRRCSVAVSRIARLASVTRRFVRSSASSPTQNGAGGTWWRSTSATRAASSAGENGLTI